MNKTRNSNATCGTCPYWDNAGGNWKHNNIKSGYCARNNERYVKSKCSWCGNHPDFWEDSDAARTGYLEKAMRDAKHKIAGDMLSGKWFDQEDAAHSEIDQLRTEVSVLREDYARDAAAWERDIHEACANLARWEVECNRLRKKSEIVPQLQRDLERMDTDLAKRDVVIARLCEAAREAVAVCPDYRAMDDAHLWILPVGSLKKLQAALDAARVITTDGKERNGQ